MSTYYDFYLYVKHEGKFKYCGPYHRNGKAASIFAVTGSSINDLLDNSESLGDRYLKRFEEVKGISLSQEYVSYYLLQPTDIQYSKKPYEGYILKSVLRRMEIMQESYELAEYIDESDNETVLSISEYKALPDEDKGKYIYHVWDFENDSRNLKIRLLEASKAWFETHTSYTYYDAKFNDCVFLVVQS